MAKINFDLTRASPDYRKGCKAAMDFLDGVPQQDGASFSVDYVRADSIGISFDDGGDNDNRTYEIIRGKVKYDSLGVER